MQTLTQPEAISAQSAEAKLVIPTSSHAIEFTLRATDSGLTECMFSRGASMHESAAALSFVSGDAARVARAHIEAAAQQLREYFAGTRTKFDLSLDPHGTPFQKQVWDAAVQIPFGQTRSYWWIAVRMGNPYASRAVGGALGANPLPIVIPCHRVLRHDGSLGGFSCGLEWKEFLLGHEASIFEQNV